MTYANVVATLALFMVLAGGTAVAATKLIKGSQIAKGTITGTNIAKKTITAANIEAHTLLSSDFKTGQLPAGATGATGATGPAGPAGPAGATGATGAAGTAVAWGVISLGSNGTPQFQANQGFPGTVTSPQTGVFCVTPPSGYLNTPVLLSSTGQTPTIFSQLSPQQCQGTNYEIYLSQGTINSAGAGFTIVVP